MFVDFELERHKEENRLLHEQINNLTSRLNETEFRFHELNQENDETVSVLGITKENQNILATELAEFKIRYQEVLSLLGETQEQLRNSKKRGQPQARGSLLGVPPVPQVDSLQSELMETSMFSEHSLDSGIALDRVGVGKDFGMNAPGYKKVFETVRCAGKSNNYNDNMLHLGVMSMSSSSQPKMSTYIQPGDNQSSYRSSSMYTSSSICPSMESSIGAKLSSTDSLFSSTDLEVNFKLTFWIFELLFELFVFFLFKFRHSIRLMLLLDVRVHRAPKI